MPPSSLAVGQEEGSEDQKTKHSHSSDSSASKDSGIQSEPDFFYSASTHRWIAPSASSSAPRRQELAKLVTSPPPSAAADHETVL